MMINIIINYSKLNLERPNWISSYINYVNAGLTNLHGLLDQVVICISAYRVDNIFTLSLQNADLFSGSLMLGIARQPTFVNRKRQMMIVVFLLLVKCIFLNIIVSAYSNTDLYLFTNLIRTWSDTNQCFIIVFLGILNGMGWYAHWGLLYWYCIWSIDYY